MLAPCVRRLSTRVAASPLGRKTAREAGFDIAALAGMGSGPGGRVVLTDVQSALAGGAPVAQAQAPAAAPVGAPVALVGDGHLDIAHTPTRATVAERLAESKRMAPHYVLTMNVGLDSLLELRARLNASLPEEEQLSVNDFLVKGAGIALKRVPEMNSSWLADVIRAYDYADVCVSVATPAGVVTPVVRDADLKGLSAISKDIRELAAGARAGTLPPEAYAGGTFTITNLGAYGVRQFTGIITPPQAGLLAVGAIEKRVVPSGATEEDAPVFTVSTQTTLSVSCDHRVVDGAVGAAWLAEMRSLLEAPETMLL